jgi:parallel beta-helix repeat protein
VKRLVILTGLIALIVAFGATPAFAATTWTVDDDLIDYPSADCTHPQDAVNAAAAGDTILVYPGTYNERRFTTPVPPHWGPSDQYAPALIVWKDGLTIKAVDPDPANTVIQTNYNFWVNKALPAGGGGGSIEHSTGGQWDPVNKVWTGPCVRPKSGTAPNACAVIASGVTIDGFTFHRPYDGTYGTYNTAGVMIGGLYAGYGSAGETLGFNNNIVQNCAFSNVWHAVYIWHSSGNKVLDNTVAPLSTNHWAGISVYDGDSNAAIALGNLSTTNSICGNSLANKGIAAGAWAPPNWTDLDGTKVCGNVCTQVGVSYAHGPVTVACNTTPGGGPAGFWYYMADMVTRLKKVSYAGDVLVPVSAGASLVATISYDGTPDVDGSGIAVTFDVVGDGGTYQFTATTGAGGAAQVSAPLPAGVYDVAVRVGVCGCCELTDSAKLVVYDPAGGFVTGGGWIMSPAGAYAADPTLEGKATFGFVSKYQKGASVPSGNTEFQFHAAGMNFKSNSYDWLVLAGAKAQYKGTGTINGTGEYKFMLTAWDGQVTGGGDVDRFRIRIWDSASGGLVYDNQTGAADGDDPTTALGGGSIVIHKK